MANEGECFPKPATKRLKLKHDTGVCQVHKPIAYPSAAFDPATQRSCELRFPTEHAEVLIPHITSQCATLTLEELDEATTRACDLTHQDISSLEIGFALALPRFRIDYSGSVLVQQMLKCDPQGTPISSSIVRIHTVSLLLPPSES